MSFGFGKNSDNLKGRDVLQHDSSMSPCNDNDHKEVKKIRKMLNRHETVLFITLRSGVPVKWILSKF
jgi:hypothetical protein